MSEDGLSYQPYKEAKMKPLEDLKKTVLRRPHCGSLHLQRMTPPSIRRWGMDEIVKELWDVLQERKKFWLLPMVTVLLLFFTLFAFAYDHGLTIFN